ncbi:HEAT repeat domain-containing protein [Tumebacillus sp. DT12]|uniref:HEAT repeat domain-containing protein n=1 Tax=Tumebacillus lacus TaxID=2995335 RepID=A0ABT3X8C3_9BACL|nr:HEAT repeat domain-containing protein [Tumebacillus lacus]MCX7571009.1 HEAT repeat domain-containing protein [Tumebacillus lacus]
MTASKKKLTLIALTLTLAAGSALSMATAMATQDDIKISKESVSQNKHINKIRELKGKPQEIDAYVSNLNTQEILEAAYELSNAGELALDQQGAMFVPLLKKRWDAGLPMEDIASMVKDKTNNDNFRSFLLDGTVSVGFKKERVASEATQDSEKEKLGDLLIELASDKSEKEAVRKYSLMKLRDVPKDGGKKAKQEKALADIVNDTDTPAAVKGAALTAMKRTNHPGLAQAVAEVMKNPLSEEGILVRHAVAEGAKSGTLKDIKVMKQLAKDTKDAEVYATTVYSIGLLGGPESVLAVLDVYGKYGNTDIANYTLERNQKTVLSMLETGQPREYILAALQAVMYAKLRTAEANVETLVNHTDIEVREKAAQVLVSLKALPVNNIPSNAEKWGN